MIRSYLLTPCLALTATFAINAQTWTEIGAGQLPATSEIPVGVGALAQIDGFLDIDDVDMYKIRITDPSIFTCSTVGGATWDTQLWMFATDGMGISFKDDDGPLQSTLTGQFVSGPQNVLIAISRYNNDCVDSNSDLLWLNGPFNVERQPDGPGAANPIDDWDGNVTQPAGTYSIFLTGAEFVDSSECFLLVGLNQWNFSLGNDPVLVEPLLVIPMTLNNLPSLAIPNNNNFIGLSIFVQSFLYNPAVYPNDPIKVSRGLDYNIGVSTTPYGPTLPQGSITMWPIGQGIAQPGGAISVNFILP